MRGGARGASHDLSYFAIAWATTPARRLPCRSHETPERGASQHVTYKMSLRFYSLSACKYRKKDEQPAAARIERGKGDSKSGRGRRVSRRKRLQRVSIPIPDCIAIRQRQPGDERIEYRLTQIRRARPLTGHKQF